MRYRRKAEGILNAQEIIESSPLEVGDLSKIWQSETWQSPRILRVHPPLKNGRTLVLDEETFVELVIRRKLSRTKIVEQYPKISSHIIDNSRILYQKKYLDALTSVKHYQYSMALRGNTHGKKSKPSILIPQDKLLPMINSGKKLSVIAKELHTSEYAVRTSVKFYGIDQSGELPYSLQNIDTEYLNLLEIFVPGLLDAAKNYYDNPGAYYDKLYLGYLNINQIIWFIKEQASGHRYYQQKKKIPKNHICWNSNQAEMILALALLDEHIQHIRQYNYFKNYQADFFFPQANLILEIQGTIHKFPSIQLMDNQKKQMIEKLGINYMEVKAQEIFTNLPTVLNGLKAKLFQLIS